MDIFSRREFLERGTILSAAAAALGPVASAQDAPRATAARQASDKLRVAVVGVRGRGMSHVGGFLNKNNCEITHVCDCDESADVIGNAMRTVERGQRRAPTFVKDVRRVVENRDIDVVSIATPNHWHALMAIWAMQNGKDVYCEKPATHNVKEGAIMTAAARKYGRICQVGTQSRSNPGMRQAIEAVQNNIGTVDLAIGLCYKNRPSIGKVDGPQQPPATMDYDLWCGPAPLEMPRRNVGRNGTVHYDWHWIWHYGNGDLGNQGVHEMDKARWGLRKGLPTSVCSVGGRFGYVDDGQTANTQVALFDYGESKMVFEVRGLKSPNFKGAGVGNIWVGTNGMVVCPNYAGGIQYDRDGREVARFNSGSDQHHFDNFVKAVRSRRREDLNCDIAEGHVSAALCHLANISYRLGAEGPIGDVAGFAGSPAAADALTRMREHLREHRIDPATAVGRAGPKLTFDPGTERFTGDRAAEANAMLFREYRRGFEVRESV